MFFIGTNMSNKNVTNSFPYYYLPITLLSVMSSSSNKTVPL
ncbi:hypothetical protein HMPREF1554_00310 [Porphyromonas gingivalis F0569]|nr:hypothetical protein HMPREF1554_00310 [Porphyromonas gingivalis F0569]